jgi:hypothetical protein
MGLLTTGPLALRTDAESKLRVGDREAGSRIRFPCAESAGPLQRKMVVFQKADPDQGLEIVAPTAVGRNDTAFCKVFLHAGCRFPWPREREEDA